MLGRASSSDIPVFDPTISRRHAELTARGTSVRREGPRVEQRHLREQRAGGGERRQRRRRRDVRQGALPRRSSSSRLAGARLGRRRGAAGDGREEAAVEHPEGAGGRGAGGPLSRVFRATDLAEVRAESARASGAARTEKRLAMLLEVSKGLSRVADAEALLDRITKLVFEIMDVDRVAIELVNDAGERIPKIARDRKGLVSGRTVPSSIARKVAGERVAVLSDNAAEDDRFGGQSIVLQSVRSAMCAPLVGAGDAVLGILYVDNVTRDAALRRRGPRLPDRLLQHRRGGAREQPLRRADPSRHDRAQQLRALLRARRSRRRSPAPASRCGWAATSARWRCSSATSAASRRWPRR